MDSEKINEQMALRYEEMMKSKKFLPLRIGHLSEEHIELSRKELNETDETREKGLAGLRKLISADKKLTCPMTDEYLLQFLRARKFDLKRSFNLLQAFYQVKKDYGECYDELDFEKLDTLAKSGATYFLPYRSPEGCAVILIEINNWDCVKNDVIQAMQMLAIMLLYAADDPVTQVCGVRFLVNVRGCSLRQIRCITPRYIRLLSKALRNCMPNRFKGIHIYNESSIFQLIWSVFQLFLSEKIKSRVHFHSDNQKQLHKFIPKEILTEEYGGSNKYFNPGECTSKMVKDFRPTLEILLRSGYKK